MKYSYHDLFQRNIGVFSKPEIKRIKKLKVAIAGAGGLGGPVAYTLTRLGVNNIIIADNDSFEPSNINRQFGANINSINKNKAEIIANELVKINPYLNVKYWPYRVTKNNVEKFLHNIDVVVEAIDFFNFVDAKSLYREAKRKGLWVFTSNAAGNILSFTAYHPRKSSFEELYGNTKTSTLNINKYLRYNFPKLPKIATPNLIEDIINGKILHISSHSTPLLMGAAIICEMIIKVAIRKKASTVIAPDTLVFDFDAMLLKKYIIRHGHR